MLQAHFLASGLMPGTLELWYLFPLSVLIATIAMTSGVGGAVFFSPLFIIVLGLPPSVAVGTALTTELFGFSSGLYAYWKRQLIDFKLGTSLLMFAVPAAIVGSLSADVFPADVLKTIFAVGIIFDRIPAVSVVPPGGTRAPGPRYRRRCAPGLRVRVA